MFCKQLGLFDAGWTLCCLFCVGLMVWCLLWAIIRWCELPVYRWFLLFVLLFVWCFVVGFACVVGLLVG